MIWFNKTLDTDTALALINEGHRPMSYHRVYKKLGRRGVLPGRRPKKSK